MPNDLKKIKEAVEEGNVELQASDQCVTNMAVPGTGRKPDFTVTAAHLKGCWSRADSQGFVLGWETKSAGFGELTIYLEGDTLHCDTEAMGKEFVREVFNKFTDSLPE